MRDNNAIQVSTGNVRTTVDVFDATKVNNGQANQLGASYLDPVTGCKYRYVQFKATATPAIQATPAAVWWVDAAKTQVTPTKSEAYAASPSFAAGLLMPNSTDVTGLTTAKLQNNFVFIAVAGVVAGVASAAAAAGDKLMATQTDWTTTGGFGKVANGAAATDKVVAYAKAASADAVDVVVESL